MTNQDVINVLLSSAVERTAVATFAWHCTPRFEARKSALDRDECAENLRFRPRCPSPVRSIEHSCSLQVVCISNIVLRMYCFGNYRTPDEEHFTLCGTPNYIAPEICTQQPHSMPADLWAVGCVFYTLITGTP